VLCCVVLCCVLNSGCYNRCVFIARYELNLYVRFRLFSTLQKLLHVEGPATSQFGETAYLKIEFKLSGVGGGFLFYLFRTFRVYIFLYFLLLWNIKVRSV
jgi:hypothetical protein